MKNHLIVCDSNVNFSKQVQNFLFYCSSDEKIFSLKTKLLFNVEEFDLLETENFSLQQILNTLFTNVIMEIFVENAVIFRAFYFAHPILC